MTPSMIHALQVLIYADRRYHTRVAAGSPDVNPDWRGVHIAGQPLVGVHPQTALALGAAKLIEVGLVDGRAHAFLGRRAPLDPEERRYAEAEGATQTSPKMFFMQRVIEADRAYRSAAAARDPMISNDFRGVEVNPYFCMNPRTAEVLSDAGLIEVVNLHGSRGFAFLGRYAPLDDDVSRGRPLRA